MDEVRRKHGAAFWVIVAMIMILLYPIGFGPACWISERTEDDGKILSFVYSPVIRLIFMNRTFGDLAQKYMKCGLRSNVWPRLSPSGIEWASLPIFGGPGCDNPTNPLFERTRDPPYGNGGGFGGGMGGPR